MLLAGCFQLSLPEGVSIDVVVSSIVDAGHIFIQQPTHPSFPSLERLNQFMIACYMQDGLVPQLPRPLEGGTLKFIYTLTAEQFGLIEHGAVVPLMPNKLQIILHKNCIVLSLSTSFLTNFKNKSHTINFYF